MLIPLLDNSPHRAVQDIVAPLGLLDGSDLMEILSPSTKETELEVSEHVVAEFPEIVQVTRVAALFFITVKT